MPEASSIMDRRTRRLFIFLTTVSFLAAIGTLVFGRKVREFTPIATDSFTDGPLGNKAFVQIMEELDVRTERKRSSGRGDDTLTWFIEPLRAEVPIPEGTARLSETLQARVTSQSPSVMVLPKWVLGQDGQAEPVPTSHIENLLTEVPGLQPQSATVQRNGMPHDAPKSYQVITPIGEYTIEVPYLQTLQLPQDFAPVIELASGGGVLMAMSNDGLVSVLSEPDLLHNFNVQRADHAAIFTGLAQWQSDDAFSIDEVFHGHAHTLSLRDALARWPAVLLPIHAVVLALLLLVRGIQRFGAPRDGARSDSEHEDEGIRVSAMALTMSNTDGRLLLRYIAAVFARIAHQNGLRANTPLARALEIDALRASRGLEAQAEILWQKAGLYNNKQKNKPSRSQILQIARRLLQDHQT